MHETHCADCGARVLWLPGASGFAAVHPDPTPDGSILVESGHYIALRDPRIVRDGVPLHRYHTCIRAPR